MKIVLRLTLLTILVLGCIFLGTHSSSDIFLSGLIFSLSLNICLWLISLWKNKAGIADVFWGGGIVMMAYLYFIKLYQPFHLGERAWIFLILVSIWGGRLAIYFLSRHLTKEEDARLATMRKESGPNWWWHSLLKVFLLQGFVIWIVSSMFLSVFLEGGPMETLSWVGMAIWFIGMVIEVWSDSQMAAFRAKSENASKVLNTGLWKYSRHPNYLGEVLVWWGFFLFSFESANNIEFIFSPLLVMLLLIFVSGIPRLEKELLETKPNYKEYMETTSSFILWPPRKRSK